MSLSSDAAGHHTVVDPSPYRLRIEAGGFGQSLLADTGPLHRLAQPLVGSPGSHGSPSEKAPNQFLLERT